MTSKLKRVYAFETFTFKKVDPGGRPSTHEVARGHVYNLPDDVVEAQNRVAPGSVVDVDASDKPLPYEPPAPPPPPEDAPASSFTGLEGSTNVSINDDIQEDEEF